MVSNRLRKSKKLFFFLRACLFEDNSRDILFKDILLSTMKYTEI